MESMIPRKSPGKKPAKMALAG
jgi:hypothetical protein